MSASASAQKVVPSAICKQEGRQAAPLGESRAGEFLLLSSVILSNHYILLNRFVKRLYTKVTKIGFLSRFF